MLFYIVYFGSAPAGRAIRFKSSPHDLCTNLQLRAFHFYPSRAF